MGVLDEKLAEADAGLEDVGADASEVSAVLGRFEDAKSSDLAAVDQELETLGQNIEVPTIEGRATIDPFTMETKVPDAPVLVGDDWDNDKTEVEIIDEADDFVLLVDEDDLEELEGAAAEAPNVTVPPPIPSKSEAAGDADEGDIEVDVDDEDDEGFFKKLFGSRRSSNRP
ncbi:MAG: hypothetical protein AAGF92_14890 [Myxococcota bacterium]